ncbi:MAG TPA: phage holin [Bacillota bacterium]|nr:phage holin [Bacillota bacterium]
MTDHDKKEEPNVIVSNKMYDFLKVFVMVIAPSASAIYLGLSISFDFPYVNAVVVTTMSVTAAIGLFLLITSKTYHLSDVYYDGRMLVKENELGELMYTLELNEDPEPLRLKSRIVFRVVSEYDRPEISVDDQ